MIKVITYLQLRASRQVLNLGIRDVENVIKISKSTISKAELGKTRDFFFKHSAALITFFEKNNINFPNEYTIRLNSSQNTISFEKQNKDTLTRFQLKAARSILNLSQLQLAQSIKVDKGIISRAELLDNTSNLKPLNKNIVLELKNMFSQHNIEFPEPLSIFFKKYIDNKLRK